MKIMFLVHILTLLGVGYLVYISRRRIKQPFDASLWLRNQNDKNKLRVVLHTRQCAEQGQTAQGIVISVGQGVQKYEHR